MGGFSLLEVVVGFAILALSLGVLWQVFSMSGRRATGVQETHRAVMLAESKVNELATTGLVARSEESGDFDETYRWLRRVERISAESRSDQAPSMRVPYRVVVEVSWNARAPYADSDGAKSRSVVLTTVRLGSVE